ncbi:substrate-binding domain-containing protein [Prosthecobacter sp.]|uniref:substrate-binding domain-containing protein n=1 Tax=Prosthecobacter sp. TaxID=1965333 RepID=UPI003784BE7B
MKAKSPPPPALPQRLSLVAQTVQSLRESIRTGHWRKHLPPERELCELLQVSRPTLRVALEELQRKGWLEVTQRQRRRIKPRRTAPGASAGKRVIAVISPYSFLTLSPQVAFLADALRERLTKAGSAVEYHVNPACFSTKPVRALEKLVSQNPAVAWLVMGAKEPMLRWFISQQLPCLVVGSCPTSVVLPSVDADHQAACRHAGGVLLRKGHRRIALVLPQGGYGGDADSEQGMRESLKDRPEAHLRVLSHDGTTAHLCALLDAAMRSPNPPTAYVVARVMPVLTVMMHLMRRGKRIPQDVAVISRDDDPFLQSTTPDVTRYAISPAQLARRVALAARQLAKTDTLEPKAIRLMAKYLPGETV